MTETLELRLGEERAVQLPPSQDPARSWTYEASGMTSAVEVRKMWTSDPYPEDDWDEEGARPPRPPAMVFMIRGKSPGRATVRFDLQGGSASRTVEVTVRS
jgi:hypothetical protein